MRELSTFAFSLAGFALFHAALPSRRASVFPRVSPAAFRLAGVGLCTLALAPLWLQSPTLAVLVLMTAGSLAATVFVLLTPVLPRVMWACAALGAPVGALLWCGGAHAG